VTGGIRRTLPARGGRGRCGLRGDAEHDERDDDELPLQHCGLSLLRVRLTDSQSARRGPERTLVRVKHPEIARSRDPEHGDPPAVQNRAHSTRKERSVQLGLGGILVIIGIILIVLGHWILGIILALIGLVFFGGFARGRWY
jgi:hypothetical protein